MACRKDRSYLHPIWSYYWLEGKSDSRQPPKAFFDAEEMARRDLTVGMKVWVYIHRLKRYAVKEIIEAGPQMIYGGKRLKHVPLVDMSDEFPHDSYGDGKWELLDGSYRVCHKPAQPQPGLASKQPNPAPAAPKTPFYAVCNYDLDGIYVRLYGSKDAMDAYLNHVFDDDDEDYDEDEDNPIDDVYDLDSCTEYLKSHNGYIVEIHEGKLYC